MRTLLLSLALFFLWPAWALVNGNRDWRMFGRGHMINWWYGGMFVWILFIVVIVVIVLLFTQTRRPGRSDSSFRDSPVDILKRRYAKGEITKEEFQRTKKDLQG